MAVLGSRRDASPIVVGPNKKLSRPTRVPFTQRKSSEGFLHKLIESNPDVLPVSEIEPAFSPLVTIGYEVPTKSGSIDLLLLSPQGYLTIVETKLWRNPEARREVVGQVVEYAKDVSQWSFEELEKKVRDYNTQRRHPGDGIMASLHRLGGIDDAAEHVITDTITRNLRNGRFLLLVVGDGIRESVEAMADYLQQTPQLHFTLGLVELQIYELPGGARKSLLVIPQVVARTREITRAVVKVEAKSIESIQVEIEPESHGDGGGASTLTEDDYFTALEKKVSRDDCEYAKQLKKDMEEYGCITVWKRASFVVALRDPGGSGQKLSLVIVSTNGKLQLSELPNQLRSIGISDQIAHGYARESAQLFGRQLRTTTGYWTKPVTLRELRMQYQQFISILRRTIDTIRQAANSKS